MSYIGRPLTVDDLPAPPSDKSGYPWTTGTEIIDDCYLLPSISVVTPSYNQGAFLEETIRSVLLQAYPNTEYIVIDGGSTDESVAIIEKYSDFISYWVSEKDAGQSNAINKGFRLVEGDYFAYINSDDRYQPQTFYKVGRAFLEDDNLKWVTGYAEYVDAVGNFVELMVPEPFSNLKNTLITWEGPRAVAIQASNFLSKEIFSRFGYLNESLHYCMDVEFGLRLLRHNIVPSIIPSVLAQARLHQNSKTVSQKQSGAFTNEAVQIAQKYSEYLSAKDKAYVLQKIGEYNLFYSIGHLSSIYDDESSFRCLEELLKVVVSHPSYLIKRPFLGMLRRMIIPA